VIDQNQVDPASLARNRLNRAGGEGNSEVWFDAETAVYLNGLFKRYKHRDAWKGAAAAFQRAVKDAIKRARFMAMMPHVGE
jgi:hypothetical protein